MIEIDKNGLTKLATAGKYCPHNVEIKVNVHDIEDALVGRTLTKYENNTATEIGFQAFRNYITLEEVYFSNVITINAGAFMGCSKLNKLVITTPSVCELINVNAISALPITNGNGNIYVLDEFVEDYKKATNWSEFADSIKPYSEL